MVNLVIALECFGIGLIFVALLLLLNGEGAREQKLLIIIMCGSLVQNVGYLLELTAKSVDDCGKCGLCICAVMLLLVYLYLLLCRSAEKVSEISCRCQFLCFAYRIFQLGWSFLPGSTVAGSGRRVSLCQHHLRPAVCGLSV